MITAPTDLKEPKLVDCRLYSWCSKCRQGQGLWVHHHTTATHVDGYRNQRRQLDNNKRAYLTNLTNTSQTQETNETLLGNPSSDPSTTPTSGSHTTANNRSQLTVPQAQLSLLEYLDTYLPEHDNAVASDAEDND
jgi:hypothetical protein